MYGDYMKYMKKIVLFLIINILPILILGLYLYANIGGAEDVKEVIENSPFKEFTYIDHKTLMMLKNDVNLKNMPEFYKESIILINGIYIGNHGSFGIKIPLGFLIKYIPIDNFKYYNGVLIKNLNEDDLGKAEMNDLVNTIPPNYKDVLIYRENYTIGIYYDLNSNKTYLIEVFRKPNNQEIDTEKLRNELLQKTNAVDCNVVDMGDKVYVYLEFNGIDLNLINNGIT
ncbi:VAR1 protein isolog [Methanocaldococcus jannaschii DSM 2661]|uniref:Uncharacterized protein MJ0995 n=2 Tax=Methanocaldococcus jannaschii TaxID=2190 RepID=Y995_METJA|nr:RecName: Full=Uncharacterized protein MJ0995 [Methanocaldococcus jannaschii DSM 2661]AAB99000.1 VAR1 protein isolog [Methanocaldococcus jannaschii DSM 2661]